MIRVVSNDTKLQGGSVFNIPPLRTCPGKSRVCEAACYATTGRFLFFRVKQAAENNLKYFKDFGNLPDISGNPKFFRFHASGDFFSKKYIQASIRFAKKHSHIPMAAYTRSWRIKELLPSLIDLSKQPNVSLWISADEETGLPDLGLRVAYMSVNDIPPERKVDLVFRSFLTKNAGYKNRLRRETRRNYINGRVCPAQVGDREMKCKDCMRCYTKKEPL